MFGSSERLQKQKALKRLRENQLHSSMTGDDMSAEANESSARAVIDETGRILCCIRDAVILILATIGVIALIHPDTREVLRFICTDAFSQLRSLLGR